MFHVNRLLRVGRIVINIASTFIFVLILSTEAETLAGGPSGPRTVSRKDSGSGGISTLRGRISSCVSSEPVELAVINVFEAGSMTLSGSDGSFEIDLPPGLRSMHIAVTHVAYQEISFLEVDLSNGSPLDICLQEVLFETPVIEVTGEKSKSIALMPSSVEMDVDAITGGALSVADPLYALKALPQITSASDFDGRFSIHGASPDANAFFLDGLLFPSPYHFGGLCSIYDASNIESFRFSASPLSASSHGATGAVIEVESRDAGQDGSDFSMGLLSSSLSTRRTTLGSGVSVAVMARRSYMDLIYDMFSGEQNTQMPNFHDIQASVSKRLGSRQSLRFSGMISGDRTLMATGESVTGYEGESTISWRRQIGALSLNWSLGEDAASPWWGRALVAYQPYTSNFDMSGNDYETMGWYGGRGTLRVDISRRAGRAVFSGGFFSSLSAIEYELSFGRGFYLASRNENSAVRLDNDGNAFIADGHNRWSYNGIYGETVYETLSFGIRAGVRAESFSRSGELLLHPRISGHRMLGQRSMLLFSWGSFSRDPAEDFGNPAAVSGGLKVEKGSQLTVSVRRELPMGMTGQAGFYLRRDRDLMTETEPVRWASSARGKSRGMQLGLERRTASFDMVLNYSWTVSSRIDGPHTLTFRPDPSTAAIDNLAPAYDEAYWYDSPYDRKHSLSIEAGRRIGERFRMSVAWRGDSGRPYTPIGEVYEREVGGYIASEGRKMSARLPAYSRLDLRAEYFWANGSCFVEVLNVTNHQNVFNLRYSEDYSTRSWYRMIPIMPGFGVKLTF